MAATVERCETLLVYQATADSTRAYRLFRLSRDVSAGHHRDAEDRR